MVSGFVCLLYHECHSRARFSVLPDKYVSPGIPVSLMKAVVYLVGQKTRPDRRNRTYCVCYGHCRQRVLYKRVLGSSQA